MEKFHLGWFLNFTALEWNDTFSATEDPWTGEFYVDLARSLYRSLIAPVSARPRPSAIVPRR